MDQSLNPKIETKEGPRPGPEQGQKQARPQGPELSGIDTSGILETVEGGDEGVELGTGKISERAKEGIGEQSQKTSGKVQQFQKQLTDEQAKALKAKLLKSPPTKDQMVKEIKTHIHRQIKLLQKDAREYEGNGNFKELTNVVMKMRQLKAILKQLIQATAEAIKNIWLKVVHEIV